MHIGFADKAITVVLVLFSLASSYFLMYTFFGFVVCLIVRWSWKCITSEKHYYHKHIPDFSSKKNQMYEIRLFLRLFSNIFSWHTEWAFQPFARNIEENMRICKRKNKTNILIINMYRYAKRIISNLCCLFSFGYSSITNNSTNARSCKAINEPGKSIKMSVILKCNT